MQPSAQFLWNEVKYSRISQVNYNNLICILVSSKYTLAPRGGLDDFFKMSMLRMDHSKKQVSSLAVSAYMLKIVSQLVCYGCQISLRNSTTLGRENIPWSLTSPSSSIRLELAGCDQSLEQIVNYDVYCGAHSRLRGLRGEGRMLPRRRTSPLSSSSSLHSSSGLIRWTGLYDTCHRA